ncbi:putative selenoprotein, partial [Neisseria gonorrhoeae]
MKHKLASWWKTIKLTANLMAGVPDYENYVAQQRKHNPNAPVMTKL